jgi:hypothetical protein
LSAQRKHADFPVKRFCFDTESNYFKHQLGIGDVEYHRQCMRENLLKQKIRFDCGIVYDEAKDCYYEFRDMESSSLVALLKSADELISHSGTRHDILLLEQVCGATCVSALWSIPHHDLLDIGNWSSLGNLARQHVPHLLLAMENAKKTRQDGVDKRWPRSSRENFVEFKLAKARFDVERTYAIFKQLGIPVRVASLPN